MTAVVVVDAEVIMIRGPQVRECLRRARMRPIYVHGRDSQGWCLDRVRLGDAVAVLERNGYEVKLEGLATEVVATRSAQSEPDGDVHRGERGLW